MNIIGKEPVGSSSPDQYTRSSIIPIIYIPNPFYQMTVQHRVQHRGASTPNSPPARYEMLSQKRFMKCQVKRQYIKIPDPRTIHHSNPNRYLSTNHLNHPRCIQIFNAPPVPMFLSKHKVQSIQDTQETVMRYYPRGHAQVETRAYGIFQTFRTNTNNQKIACAEAKIMASQYIITENCLCCGEDHGITIHHN